MAIFMVGCGDETTVKGYTDEDVLIMFNIFKDSVVQGITDSVIQASKDTVYQSSKDTIYLATKDTVYSVTTKDSIVYIYKTDTVRNVFDDTVLIRVIDSIYHHVESVSDEIPRDTTITLSDTTESGTGFTVISRTWHGKVFQGVFYDTTVYEAAYEGFPQKGGSNSSSLEYYCWHQCGNKVAPDRVSPKGCWNSRDDMLQRFDGWRVFNFADILSLNSNLETIVGQDSIYFRATRENIGEYNRYEYVYHRILSNGEIVTSSNRTRYLCAYNLADK